MFFFFPAFGTHDQFGLNIEGAAPSGPSLDPPL